MNIGMKTYKYICKYTYNSKTLSLSSINRKGRLNSPLSKHMDNVSYPARQPLDLDLLLFFLVKPESATKCRIRRHGRIRRRLTRNGFFLPPFQGAGDTQTGNEPAGNSTTSAGEPFGQSFVRTRECGVVVCVSQQDKQQVGCRLQRVRLVIPEQCERGKEKEKEKKPGSYFVSRPTFFLFCFCDFPPCPSSVGTQNNFGWRPGQNKNKKNWLELDDENIPETILYLSV